MRTPTILLLAAIFFLGSCDSPKGSIYQMLVDIDTNATNLNNNLRELDVPSQTFLAPGDQVSLIRGRKGTAILVSPGDLETLDGQAPPAEILVELKELTTQAELAKADAQTMSNGRLLVSGGAYYINMVSDGKQLKLKKDKTLKVAFPKFTDSAMLLYYGNNDSGIMNWLPTNVPLNSKEGYSVDGKDTTTDKSIMVYDPRTVRLMGYVGTDSTYKRDTATLNAMRKVVKDSIAAARIREYFQRRFNDSVNWAKRKPFVEASTRLDRQLYDIVNISQLGFVNVDKLDRTAARTNITYTVDPKDSVTYAKIYLIYVDINSVVTTTFFNGEDYKKKNGTRDFNDIPIGYKARLLAVTSKNNELYACKMDLTIVKDQHTLIRWKKVSKQELNDYFDVNNNWGQ